MTTTTQITSNQIVQQPATFQEPGAGPAVTPYEVIDEDTDEFDEDPNAAGVSIQIEAPESISIESQQTRALSDGQIVVDVVLNVQEVLGATNYEIRFV